MSPDQRLITFDQILQQEEGWSLSRVSYHAQRLLAGYDIRGKRVLDIGCGKGAFSVYFALMGAGWVVGIDPAGAGGSEEVLVAMPARIQHLELPNCEFWPVEFAPGLFDSKSFDLVFLHNSVNHLHETTSDLNQDPEARAIYRDLVSEMFHIMVPGGTIVMSDCARSNLFAPLVRLGFGHPVPGMAAIDWDKHQEPGVWQRLLQDAGFTDFSLAWYVPAPLKRFERLINNRLVNFCTFSHFTIYARRPEATA